MKVIDTDNVSGAVRQAGTLTLLNGVSTGTDYTNRVGRKILIKSLLFRVFITPSATTSAPVGDFVRIMLIWDCQANSAAASVSDVLQTTSYDAPINLTNRDRFKILTDKYVAMNPNTYTAGAPTGGNPRTASIKVYKKMSMETIYSGTGSTIGSIQSGALYLLMINALDNASFADTYTRVRFLDA